MGHSGEGTAPSGHYKCFVTTDKLCRYLDMADEQGLEVVVTEHVGSRDWVIVTRGGPIIGPAGRRVFTTRKD